MSETKARYDADPLAEYEAQVPVPLTGCTMPLGLWRRIQKHMSLTEPGTGEYDNLVGGAAIAYLLTLGIEAHERSIKPSPEQAEAAAPDPLMDSIIATLGDGPKTAVDVYCRLHRDLPSANQLLDTLELLERQGRIRLERDASRSGRPHYRWSLPEAVAV